MRKNELMRKDDRIIRVLEVVEDAALAVDCLRILTACVDAYSGMCCGYSLSWEGGVYSLRNLMINVIADKVEWCRRFGIGIKEANWNCNQLPATLVTDMGAEYRQHEIDDDAIRKYYMEFHYAFCRGRNAANEYLENEVMDEKAALYFEKEFYDRGLLDIAYLYQEEYSLVTLGGSVIPLYVKVMQGSNPYLKFNHLTGKFDVFANRYIEQRRVNKILCGEKGFKWLSDIEKFTKTKGIEYIPSLATKLVSDEEIIEYCEQHMGKIWVDDEKKNILDDLGYMMALSPKYTRNKVNKGFESFYIPYYIDELYTSRNGKNKRGIKIVER